MIKFIFDQNRGLEIEPSVLLVPEFKALYDDDTSEAKWKFYALCSYMFLMFELDKKLNPITELRQEQRQSKAIEWSKIDKAWLDEELYCEAEAAYLEYSSSTLNKALDTIDQKISELNDLLRSTKPICKEVEDAKGNLKILDNSGAIGKFVILLGKFAEQREKFGNILFSPKESAVIERKRGQVKTSYLEERYEQIQKQKRNRAQ